MNHVTITTAQGETLTFSEVAITESDDSISLHDAAGLRAFFIRSDVVRLIRS